MGMLLDKVVSIIEAIMEHVENPQVELPDVTDDRSTLMIAWPLVLAIPRVFVAFGRQLLALRVRWRVWVDHVDELEVAAHEIAHVFVVISVNTVTEQDDNLVPQELDLGAVDA